MRVLVVEDNAMFQEEVRDILEEMGEFEIISQATNTQEAMHELRQSPPPDLVLLDIYLPAGPGQSRATVQGPRIAKEVRKLLPEARMVVISSLDREEASSLIRGEIADDFVTKDSPASELEARIAHQARAARRLAADLSRSGVQVGGGIHELIGSSPVMGQVRTWLDKASLSRAPVLVTGESGCGKELAAWSLHRRSPWARGPFLPFNAAAVGEGLLEAELFGYQKGAFTGASENRAGVVETAAGGSLFLDEIGELPLAFQVKLLRFLDTGTFHRLGEDRPRPARVRLIFATNRDLPEEVRQGRFRQDLLYRLDVLHLRLPPLRTRREDIPELARFLVRRLASSQGAPPPELSPEVLGTLQAHHWPGNVRELRNVLERSMIMAPGPVLDLEAVRASLAGPGALSGPGSLSGPGTLPAPAAAPCPVPAAPPPIAGSGSPLAGVPGEVGGLPGMVPVPTYTPGRLLKESVEAFEKDFLAGALAHHEGNVTATAKALGIARRTLQEKMVRYQLR